MTVDLNVRLVKLWHFLLQIVRLEQFTVVQEIRQMCHEPPVVESDAKIK